MSSCYCYEWIYCHLPCSSHLFPAWDFGDIYYRPHATASHQHWWATLWPRSLTSHILSSVAQPKSNQWTLNHMSGCAHTISHQVHIPYCAWMEWINDEVWLIEENQWINLFCQNKDTKSKHNTKKHPGMAAHTQVWCAATQLNELCGVSMRKQRWLLR